jgi:hypothetical protein
MGVGGCVAGMEHGWDVCRPMHTHSKQMIVGGNTSTIIHGITAREISKLSWMTCSPDNMQQGVIDRACPQFAPEPRNM